MPGVISGHTATRSPAVHLVNSEPVSSIERTPGFDKNRPICLCLEYRFQGCSFHFLVFDHLGALQFCVVQSGDGKDSALGQFRPSGGEQADTHTRVEAIGRMFQGIGIDGDSQRTKRSSADRDPDVIDLARINLRLDLKANRLPCAENKFVRAEREIRALSPRSCRVPSQTVAA